MPPVAARGLRVDQGVGVKLGWAFQPSIGILARDIDKLGLDIRSFREPLTRAIKQVMIPSIRKNFTQGGRPEPWEPLADYTQELRYAQGYSPVGPILVRSGSLMRNMGFLSMWTVTQNFATIKDLPQRIWYGKVQQSGIGGFAALVSKHGGDIGKAISQVDEHRSRAVNIPARPFVLIQEGDANDIQKVFDVWLGERAARSGKFRSVRV